jgi:DNA polymerase
MMDARQREYLQALGVDVWVRRELASNPSMSMETKPTQSAAPTVVASNVKSVASASPPITTSLETPRAESISVAAMNWAELQAQVKDCSLCGLEKTRTQTVFGVGNRQATWMVIGEAPGADEDAQGEPFVGRAGQLLNSMLRATGLKREEVFIANILKCRPPQNRDPTPSEVSCCIPYLHRQIELVNPKLILCVGRIAAQNLLNTQTPIGKLRGQVHRLGTQQRPVVVTYHPAYLLRSPGEKRRAWQDLVLAMDTLAQLSGV